MYLSTYITFFLNLELEKIIFNICISQDCGVVGSCNEHFRVFITEFFGVATLAVSLISYISMSFFFHINIPI